MRGDKYQTSGHRTRITESTRGAHRSWHQGRRTILREWVRANRVTARLLRKDHYLARRLRADMIATPQYGLTAEQIALLRRLRPVFGTGFEHRVPVPVDGEWIEIKGVLVNMKKAWRGRGFKMTVQVETPRGSWLCWGTVPRQLLGDDIMMQGTRIQFTALVRRNSQDKYFGFFSKPTNARRLT